jgi:dTDP-glucose 4,6-dehydratase
VSKHFLVTGGLGFIGSAFVRHIADRAGHITNVDLGTYAADSRRLAELPAERVRTASIDVAADAVVDLFSHERPDVVVHFAAETHVTRSESHAHRFWHSNVDGTRKVLDACDRAGVSKFVHVSTDEIYGPCGGPPFRERDKAPGEGFATSAYARSKAVADDLVLERAHRVPAIVARPTNCFGPWQHPEKAIPRWATRALAGSRVPVWGDGKQVRDWMHVQDVCEAIELLVDRGLAGSAYNIAPEGDQHTNLDIARAVARAAGADESLVYLTAYDRPQHDRRYAIDSSKIRSLGWRPQRTLDEAVTDTVEWYAAHREWWKPLAADAEGLYFDARERASAL